MDATERTDALLAQLDCLIALGHVDAARELVREVRTLVRGAGVGRTTVASKSRRDIVLEPLARVLRRQRALEADLRAVVVLGEGQAAEVPRLIDGQRRLLREIEPVRDGPAASHSSLSVLKQGLVESAVGMDTALQGLLASDLMGALKGMETADDALVRAMRWVDRALGSPSPTPVVSESFVSRYLGRRMPDWELPNQVGLALHQRMAPMHLPVDLRRELVKVSHYLGEGPQAETVVRLKGDERAPVRTLEIPLQVPGESRYLVQLVFQPTPEGPRPFTGPTPEALPTWGGTALVQFSQDLDEARLVVLRLEDGGPGPFLGYKAQFDGPAVRRAVYGARRQRYRVAEVRPGPVQAEVLRYIDSLASLEEEGPVAQADLRHLGIPWYDAADLADRLRPVQERLVFELVDPVGPASDFPGLVWLDRADHAFVSLHWGEDGQTPTVVVPRELLRHIGWLLGHEMTDADRPSLSVLMGALRLNLGLKLAMHDRIVEDGDAAVIERAARALERHFLQSAGVGPDVVADLFARMSLTHERAMKVPPGETDQQRRDRKAHDLFEARAGEEFVKAGRMPLSALFGAYRQTLIRGLQNRGRRRAAASAGFLSEFDDAGLLFANLVREPDTQDGVLIVGDSKIGKSSITARLVTGVPSRGVPPWVFGASDRVLVLVPRDGPAVAMPSPAHRSFGQWTQELWFRDADQREIRPPDAVPTAALLPIRSVVFVRRDGAQFRGPGLEARSIADLVLDFQQRFGFGSNRRFWTRLFDRVSVHDVSLRRRGADTFHEAADGIRAHVAAAPGLLGHGRPILAEVERVEGWFGIRPPPGPIRVTRVGIDGIDIDYFLHPDGTVLVRPAQLGQILELGRRGTFGLEGPRTLVPIDSARLENHHGRPQYRVAAGRWMPLSAEYYRSTLGGDAFLVPALPPAVRAVALRTMERDDPTLWGGWLESEE